MSLLNLDKLPAEAAAALAPLLADAEQRIADSVRGIIQGTRLKGTITITVDLALEPPAPTTAV